jgi:hypothetical protein
MASRLGITMSRKAVSEDPFFPIEESRGDRISEFPELPEKEMNPCSGRLNEVGSELWI